jgi:iron uptake system component EfeO
VAVTATDSECRVATTALDAGAHTFEVRNGGGQVTEVYVYGPGDKVIGERENIGPGTTARFGVTLSPGTYQVACKPGQKGSGIRQAVTVSAKP